MNWNKIGYALWAGWGALFFACSSLSASAASNGFRYSPVGISILYSLNPDGISLALPTEVLQAKLKQTIEKMPIKPSEDGVEGAIKSADVKFLNATLGGNEFVLQITIDAEAWKPGLISTGFNCSAVMRFTISPSPIIDMAFSPLGNDTTCDIHNDLLKSFTDSLRWGLSTNLPAPMSRELLPVEVLAKMNADREILRLSMLGFISGTYCNDSKGRISICANFRWGQESLKSHMDALVRSAPWPKGTPDLSGLGTRRDELRQIARRKPVGSSSYAFPAGLYGTDDSENGRWETGDMALFGGLLCLSGESEGCTLLKCSQSDSGQFWRSPAHLGELPTPHHSPFSGDQFNGVAAFFLGNTDPSACPIPGSASLSNKERLESYIKFVSGNKTSYSSSQTYPDYGFKSCQETPGNETCLLQGKEWAWLKILSDKVGASPDPTIPSDLQDFESRYGFKWDFLEWMASSSAIGKYGFETHLVGVEIFLAQMAGISHPSIQRAAAILTARQPTNPFFLYLHLGRDQRVVDALRATCFVNPAPGAGGDWAWQRDLMYEEAWKSSMGWDCIFMLNLMLGGSGQNPNLAFSVPAETAYTDVNNGCAGQHKVVQECRIAEPGKVILQSTARLDLVEHRGAKPPAESCAMTFSDYVGVVPDVAFPSKVCVEARAQSFAGYDSNHCWVGVGNSGRAVCSFRAAQNPIQ